MSELKPCPFCGKTARIRSEACTEGVVFYAECGNRLCSVHPRVSATTVAVAAEIWNRRAEVPKRIDGKPAGMSAEQFDACYEEDGEDGNR